MVNSGTLPYSSTVDLAGGPPSPHNQTIPARFVAKVFLQKLHLGLPCGSYCTHLSLKNNKRTPWRDRAELVHLQEPSENRNIYIYIYITRCKNSAVT